MTAMRVPTVTAEQRLLTRRQIAAICGVSVRTVESWGANGPPMVRLFNRPRAYTVSVGPRAGTTEVRDGGTVRYPRDGFEAWLAERMK
jgi:hypothetical protein